MRFGDVNFNSFILINGVTGPSGRGIEYGPTGAIRFGIPSSSGITGSTGISFFSPSYSVFRNAILTRDLSFLNNYDAIGVNMPGFGATSNLQSAIFFNPNSQSTNVWKGVGIFWDADFNDIGDYTNEPFMGIRYGMWFPGVTADAEIFQNGNVFIYSSGITGPYLHYKVIDKTNPTDPPNVDDKTYQKITISDGKGYIKNADPMEWDWENNQLISRSDQMGNSYRISKSSAQSLGYTGSPIFGFPWGSERVYNNKIEGSIFYLGHLRIDNYGSTSVMVTNNDVSSSSVVVFNSESFSDYDRTIKNNIFQNSNLEFNSYRLVDFNENVFIDSSIGNIGITYNLSYAGPTASVNRNYLIGSTFGSFSIYSPSFQISDNYLNNSTLQSFGNNVDYGSSFFRKNLVNGSSLKVDYLSGNEANFTFEKNYFNQTVLGFTGQFSIVFSENYLSGSTVINMISAKSSEVKRNVFAGLVENIVLTNESRADILIENYFERGSILKNFEIQTRLEKNHLSTGVPIIAEDIGGGRYTTVDLGTIRGINWKPGATGDKAIFTTTAGKFYVEEISKDISLNDKDLYSSSIFEDTNAEENYYLGIIRI
jgi:hypothetical protein